MRKRSVAANFDTFGVMLDCSRGAVHKKETLFRMIDILSAAGYNMLQLYTEDVYEVKDEPYFGYLRGRYSGAELKEIDAYASSKGIELIPCVQALAHLSGIMRWDVYSRECLDFGDILLVGEERTYELIDHIFASLAENFKSRRVNIGMDEAHMVGLGKYLDKHGLRDRFDILCEHLDKVVKIAEKYGFRPMMWSDMFFRLLNQGNYYADGSVFDRSVVDKVPQNLDLVYWDYYARDKEHYDKMIKGHLQFNNPVWFGGGAWTWKGFAPQNEFSMEATANAIRSCIEHGVRNMFITCWKDDGAECSLFGVLPSLIYAAQCAKGDFDIENTKKVFKRIIGADFDAFMLADLPDCKEPGKPIYNPSKYLLYADPFVGMLDYQVKEDMPERYAKIAEKLRKNVRMREFGYIFRTLSDLCDAVSVKCDLGVRTRELYRKGDKAGLLELAKTAYPETMKRVKKLYKSLEEQWAKENKENGFEVLDIRFGGLLNRLSHCQKMLSEYAEGKIGIIEPLEEEILPFCSDAEKGEDICYNGWVTTAMVKPFS